MTTNKPLEDIKRTLKDIYTICTKNNIEYRVIGSLAMVGVVGRIYRFPADVDFLFETSKKEILFAELVRMGYKSVYQDNMFDSIFPNPLQRFQKGNQICEPRGGRFKNGCFEYDLLVPISFIPRSLRPHATLCLRSKFLTKYKYDIDGVEFIGLGKEALLTMLETFKSTLAKAEGDDPKRKMDLAELGKVADKLIMQEINAEGSGIRFLGIPLLTTSNMRLLGFLARMARG